MVDCTEDVFDENRKWMRGFAAEMNMNPEFDALWKHILVLVSSMPADF